MLAYATVHDDISFDKVVQVSIKTSSSPELPVLNQLTQQDLQAYTKWRKNFTLIKHSDFNLFFI